MFKAFIVRGVVALTDTLSLSAVHLLELIPSHPHSADCFKVLFKRGFTWDEVHNAYTELIKAKTIRETELFYWEVKK